MTGTDRAGHTAAPASVPIRRIVQVFNNNAVLVNDNGQEQVLVGRGLGFHKRPGDAIATSGDGIQASYVEISEERRPFLASIAHMDPHIVATVTQAVELAADILGELHPSVYVLLAEHLSVAIDRVGRGEHIDHTLSREIGALFPREQATADLVVRFLNSQLDDIELPLAEAAYVALHLNAARSGGRPVKEPLATANAVSRAATIVRSSFPTPVPLPDMGLTAELIRLVSRLSGGSPRRNDLVNTIRRDLAYELEVAETVVAALLDDVAKREERTGWARDAETSNSDARAAMKTNVQRWKTETAYLAVFLHGWRNQRSRDP